MIEVSIRDELVQIRILLELILRALATVPPGLGKRPETIRSIDMTRDLGPDIEFSQPLPCS